MCDSNQLYKNTNRTKLDEFGGHALHCASNSSGFLTKYWHNPLVSLFAQLSRMAGFETKTEVDNILVVGPSGMRADVVLKGKDQLVNFILDVRTCDPATSDICVLAFRCPGAAADAGAKEKIKKWGSYVDAQGDSFIPLCIEAGGRVGPPVEDFIDRITQKIGNTTAEKGAFKTYCWQRIYMASQLGVAKTIRANAPFPCGPCHVGPHRGTWNIGTPVHQPREGPLLEQLEPFRNENANGITRPGWPQLTANRLAAREPHCSLITQQPNRDGSYFSGLDSPSPGLAPLPRPPPRLS